MLADRIPGLLLAAALCGTVLAAAWRARRWRIGRPAPVDWLRGLLAVPSRYLVDVHAAVLRDAAGNAAARTGGAATARMHVLTAGGLVLSVPLILLRHGLGVGGTALALALLFALAMMAAGIALVFLRRRPRPPRLSGGAFDRLPFALAAFVAFFVRATVAAAGFGPPLQFNALLDLALAALGVWACIEIFVLGPANGPMRHALAGALHLAFHPRPQRFGAGAAAACGPPPSALLPLDLDKPRLGAQTVSDFRWNQLLGFDACVQCGRCEAACPAFAAGLPLNPKKLIQDLAASCGDGASDAAYAGSPHPGRPAGQARGGAGFPLVGAGAMVEPDSLWACTTCRACVYECPMMIEHVDAVVELRRFQTLELGATPGKAVQALDELRATDTVCGRSTASRLDWAADLGLAVLGEGAACDVLLWLGEAAFDLRGQRTLRALVRLLRAAGVDFAVLGADELDCGDLARRLGDEATFVDLARRNIETLSKRRFQRILTADPHVLHALRNEYPAYGGRYEVWHHAAFLERLLGDGRLAAGKATPETTATPATLTFHDPCYLSRYNGEVDAPRRLLRSIGIQPVEMKRSGLRSSCCGWGGGAAFTDVPGPRRIPDVRMEHVREAGATAVAVACPNCAVMLEGVVAPRPEVVDLAELVLAATLAGAGS
jgi:dimethylglycine catabolism B